MDNNIIQNIKQSFIGYFDSSQSKKIEDLFDNIIIILWKNDKGKITYTFDNKETQHSDLLKKYLKDNWNNIIAEGLEGFSLPNAESPTIFANSESDTLIAVLIHEILHLLLNEKLNTSHVVEHDFLSELIIEYTTQKILIIYNDMFNQKNTQYSTYLQLDELLGFPIRKIYKQLENVIKNDTTTINQFVNIVDRMTISTYFQDLLDKALSGDEKKSFIEQYKEYINEYSIELDKTAENIIRNCLDCQEKTKSHSK